MSTNTITSRLSVQFEKDGSLCIYGISPSNCVTFILELSYTSRRYINSLNMLSSLIKNEFHGESIYTHSIAKGQRSPQIIFTMSAAGSEIRNPKGLLKAVRNRIMPLVVEVEKEERLHNKVLVELMMLDDC
jgi:hypothetical protein